MDALDRVLAAAVQRRASAHAAQEPGAADDPTRQPAVAPRAPAAGLLQRKVGFEAELSVPSLPPKTGVMTDAFATAAKGSVRSATIEWFLRGGLPYGDGGPLGAANGHFHLAADHNELQTRHQDIRKKLWQLGYWVPARVNTMSNLEYVTVAVDELAANSTTAIGGHIDAIVTHAQGVLATAKTQAQALAAPAAGAYAGFPEADFMAWLEPADKPAMQPLIDAFKAATRDEFYLQATVGIIPSALPALFKSRTSTFGAGDVFTDAADRVHETVKALLAKEDFAGAGWVADLKARHPIDYQGFEGMLYLIYSYMVGDAINQTDLLDRSSEKNAVPFMSKLAHMGLPMQTAVPDHIRRTGVPANVMTQITDYFAATAYIDVDHWKQEWGLHDTASARGAVLGNPGQFVKAVLEGSQPAVMGTPRHFAAPDAMPAAVQSVSGQQEAIQLEYRYINERPGTAGLKAELFKVVNEVRELNTQHMGWLDRRRLLAAADQ